MTAIDDRVVATNRPTALARPLREFAYRWIQYRRTWRSSIVIGLVNPLLFCTGIGIGIGRLVDSAASGPLHGTPYLTFLAPGVLAASAMQMGFGAGAWYVQRAASSSGSYRMSAATPLTPTDILLGHLLYSAFQIGLLSVGFFVVQAALGAAPRPESLLTVPAAVLTGLAFAAPVSAWAVERLTFKPVQVLFRFLIQPLYLVSGTFFPLSSTPAWVQKAAWLSPLWHGVELCRRLNLGTLTFGGLAVHGGILAVMVVGGVAAARVAFQRRLHQ
jgi:lipooligosaccharide transport system permease protein